MGGFPPPRPEKGYSVLERYSEKDSMGSPLLSLLLLSLLLPLFPMLVVVPRPTRRVWPASVGSVRDDRQRTTAQRAAGGGSEYPLHARVERDSRRLGILEGVHR